MNVLIIEDEPAIAMVLCEVLRDEGHSAEAFTDGTAALRRLLEEPIPDLVLVDLFMPRFGGRELLTAMRSDARLAAVPVILLTGAVPHSEAFPPEGSYQALITKPFDVDELVAVVNSVSARRFSA
ncbi:MAG: response regulator [Bacillota bacterium]